jgi:moderate conductance mechanosensitive channel
MPHQLTHILTVLHLNNTAFWFRFGHASLDTLWDVVKIVVLYILLRRVLKRVVGQIIIPVISRSGQHADPEYAARLKTLTGLLNSVVGYALIFVFGVMLLRAFHLDPIPLLTTASVAGLAVGFGAQKLVKDVISGFFILLENQYAVGDYVTIGAVTGTVEEIGMRTTRIRDDAGKLYIVSNGDITQVCNQSRGAVAAFIDVGVAVTTDINQATDIINAAGKELQETHSDLLLAEAPHVLGLGGMEAAKLTLRVTCPVLAPSKLTDAQIALRSLIHQRLVEAGIVLA